MAVEGEHTLMEVTGGPISGSLANEPLEDGVTLLFRETFRMPLDSQNTLILVALDGFDDPISRTRRHQQMVAGVGYRLMMERVDVES